MLDNVAQKQLFNIITIMRSPFCYALSAKHPPTSRFDGGVCV